MGLDVVWWDRNEERLPSRRRAVMMMVVVGVVVLDYLPAVRLGSQSRRRTVAVVAVAVSNRRDRSEDCFGWLRPVQLRRGEADGVIVITAVLGQDK